MSDAIISEAIIASRGSPLSEEESTSAVSWAAIIAGAVISSAFSLALLSLGAGIGLVSVSPWSVHNASVATFGVLAGAWFIAVELFACGLGGYLAGRLRTRWVGVHSDEVYFRDTAHGLLVWAVGAVVTALLLAGAASAVASGAARVGQAAAGAPARQAPASVVDPTAYFTDMLFRSDHPAATGDEAARAETGRILVKGLAAGELPAPDKTYVAQLVAARAGLSQPDAEKRVGDVFEQAKAAATQAADAARKTGVYVALWAFISLLVGAFSASYMAMLGGRLRDGLPATG
jgi:hypothetical protein